MINRSAPDSDACHAQVDRLAAEFSSWSYLEQDYVGLRRVNLMAPEPDVVILLHRLFADQSQEFLHTQPAHRGDEPLSGSDYYRWMLVAHCLALVQGRHSSGARTGEVLASLWYSEPRLIRLLTGDFSGLLTTLPNLARLLHRRQARVNWWPLTRLALFAGVCEPLAESARLEISRGYAAAQYNSK